MGNRARTAGHIATIAVLAFVGVVCAAYVLVKERAPVPFRDTYEIKVAFASSDGVVPGLGQPVNVAGVKVGQISGADLAGGSSVVTLELERDQLPRVHANAAATLVPITPLKDMRIDLDPGEAPARALKEGARIGVESTAPPVPLAELLSALDLDTRTFLSSMIESFDQGTQGRAPDLRAALRALGPTAGQVGSISRSLEKRRNEIQRLVTNLSVVTRAASRDERLQDVVQAGNATLEALARQDVPLRQAIAKLPDTLDTTRSTLINAANFSGTLKPAVSALLPSVRRLPGTLEALRPFADTGAAQLRRNVRPLVREAQPLARDLSPLVTRLSAVSPDVTTSLQVFNGFMNEFAYNPAGDDEGFLFWFSWFAHNWNSLFATGDAHGGIGRAMVMVSCSQFADLLSAGPVLQTLLGAASLCP